MQSNIFKVFVLNRMNVTSYPCEMKKACFSIENFVTPSYRRLFIPENKEELFNPLVTNGISHPYHLDESTVIVRGVRSKFSFLCPQL